MKQKKRLAYRDRLYLQRHGEKQMVAKDYLDLAILAIFAGIIWGGYRAGWSWQSIAIVEISIGIFYFVLRTAFVKKERQYLYGLARYHRGYQRFLQQLPLLAEEELVEKIKACIQAEAIISMDKNLYACQMHQKTVGLYLGKRIEESLIQQLRQAAEKYRYASWYVFLREDSEHRKILAKAGISNITLIYPRDLYAAEAKEWLCDEEKKKEKWLMPERKYFLWYGGGLIGLGLMSDHFYRYFLIGCACLIYWSVSVMQNSNKREIQTLAKMTRQRKKAIIQSEKK